MITPTTTCYFVLKVDEEVAGSIISELSKRVANDVESILLASGDFSNDIEASLTMEKLINCFSNKLESVSKSEKFNPIYLPYLNQKWLDAFDLDDPTGGWSLNAVDGNPFTVKTVELKDQFDKTVVEGRLRWHTFELPSYEEIILNKVMIS